MYTMSYRVRRFSLMLAVLFTCLVSLLAIAMPG